MGSLRWTAPYGGLLVIVFTISLMLTTFQGSASGTTDYLRSGGGTICTASDFTTPGNACDGNDTTAATMAVNHACTAYNDTYAPIAYFDMAAPHNITYVRVKFAVPCGTVAGSQIEVSQSPSGCSGQITYTAGTSQDKVVALTTGTCVSTSRIRVRVWNDGSGASTLYLYSVEGFTSAPSFMVDYVQDLEAHDALFSKWFTWNWAKSFTGYWDFHRKVDDSPVWQNASSAGIYKDFQVGYSESNDIPGAAHTAYPSDLCGIGGCTSAGWVLHVHDNAGGGIDVYYDIAANASGTLIAVKPAPVIGLFSLTYVGSTKVATYLYGWGPAGTTADVCIGQRGVNPLYEPIDTCLVTKTGQVATSTPASGAQNGTMTLDATKSNVVMIRVTNAQGTAFRSVTLTSLTADGGGSSVAPIVVKAREVCDGFVDVACEVRNLGRTIGDLLTGVFDVGLDVLVGAYDNLYNVLAAKQPFATILGSAAAVGAQLARATDSVSTSSTCSGLVLTMPSLPPVAYTGFAGPTTAPAWPSSQPMPSFAVLACADLEPMGGTTLWQSIRSVMDPAIYLAYGFALLKRFQPKTQLSA